MASRTSKQNRPVGYSVQYAFTIKKKFQIYTNQDLHIQFCKIAVWLQKRSRSLHILGLYALLKTTEKVFRLSSTISSYSCMAAHPGRVHINEFKNTNTTASYIPQFYPL